MFLAFQEAQLAREIRNGYKLDKSHILVVDLFDDFEFERYMKVPDEWIPAETKAYTRSVSCLPDSCVLLNKKEKSGLSC